MTIRAQSNLLVLCGCLVIVALVPTQPPALGPCGTAYYFLLFMVSSAIAHGLNLGALLLNDKGGEQAMFFVLNLVFAGAPLVALYLGRIRLGWRYVPAMSAWIGVYMVGYFFAFPTRDCP